MKTSKQNVNESYHHVVWNLAPKEQLNSPLEIKLAVEIATLLLNSGMKSTYNSIFIDAGISISENMLLQWEDMDDKRKQEKLWKQKEETKSRRKALKQRNIKQQQAFVQSEGRQHKSAAFHENSSK